MPKRELPNQRQKGGRVEGAPNPLPKAGRGGRITTWKPIHWTRKKLTIAGLLIGTPYLVAVIASVVTGLTLITSILVGLGILVLILYALLRWLDQAEL